MITLNVPDMSCGHCKAAVEKAVASVDPAATVAVDLPSRTVDITSTVPTEGLIAALATEGYSAKVA